MMNANAKCSSMSTLLHHYSYYHYSHTSNDPTNKQTNKQSIKDTCSERDRHWYPILNLSSNESSRSTRILLVVQVRSGD